MNYLHTRHIVVTRSFSIYNNEVSSLQNSPAANGQLQAPRLLQAYLHKGPLLYLIEKQDNRKPGLDGCLWESGASLHATGQTEQWQTDNRGQAAPSGYRQYGSSSREMASRLYKDPSQGNYVNNQQQDHLNQPKAPLFMVKWPCDKQQKLQVSTISGQP